MTQGNGIRLRGGYMQIPPIPERDKFTLRMHSDMSFNPDAKQPYIGYGFCLELPEYSAKHAIPAYGYGIVEKDTNSCSVTGELWGVIRSMQDTGIFENLEIVCDNNSTVAIINYLSSGQAKPNHFTVNRILREAMDVFVEMTNPTITANEITGHNGNPYNHAANMLARLARRGHENNDPDWYIVKREANMRSSFVRMNVA